MRILLSKLIIRFIGMESWCSKDGALNRPHMAWKRQPIRERAESKKKIIYLKNFSRIVVIPDMPGDIWQYNQRSRRRRHVEKLLQVRRKAAMECLGWLQQVMWYWRTD